MVTRLGVFLLVAVLTGCAGLQLHTWLPVRRGCLSGMAHDDVFQVRMSADMPVKSCSLALRSGSAVMAIGEVPAGFLGEDQLGDWVNLKKSSALGAAATMSLPDAAVALLDKVQTDSQSISFDEVISMIDANFDVSPTEFSVGDLKSAPGENMGSSKILSLGRLTGLSEQETLCLFGEYYKDVCANPSGTDHPNIRNFMKGGWGAVEFKWGLSISVPVEGEKKAFSTSKAAVAAALQASKQIGGDDEWDPDSEIWIP